MIMFLFIHTWKVDIDMFVIMIYHFTVHTGMGISGK